MGGEVDRIERKLQAVLAEKHCQTCARRTEACPSCGRPVGGLPGDGDAARHRIVAEIERLAATRERIREQVDRVE